MENNFSLEKSHTRNYKYLDGIKSQTELYRAVFKEHFSDILPVVHFTTAAAGEDLNHLINTGFIKKFTEEGSQGKLHVGVPRPQDPNRNFRNIDMNMDNLRDILQMLRDISVQFMHHSRRTNKNSLGKLRDSEFVQPVAIIFNSDGQFMRGTDNYFHWILKNNHGPDKIIALFELEAGAASKHYEPDEETQNKFVAKFLNALGRYRLKELVNLYNNTKNTNEREQIKEYAHGLLRARLISDTEFSAEFNSSAGKDGLVIDYAA